LEEVPVLDVQTVGYALVAVGHSRDFEQGR